MREPFRMLILVDIYFNKYLYQLIVHKVHCWVLENKGTQGLGRNQDVHMPSGGQDHSCWRLWTWCPEHRGATSGLLLSGPSLLLLTDSRLSCRKRKILSIPHSRQHWLFTPQHLKNGDNNAHLPELWELKNWIHKVVRTVSGIISTQ